MPEDQRKAYLRSIFEQGLTHLKVQMDKSVDGKPMYVDVADYLTQTFADKQDDLCNQLQLLEAQAFHVLGEDPARHPARAPERVPQRPAAAGPVQRKATTWAIQLWHISYEERGSVKGGAGLSSVLDIAKDFICDMANNTAQHPIQILFEYLGAKPGDLLKPFSVGISNGCAVVTASYLVCICASQLSWLTMTRRPGVADGQEIAVEMADLKELARRLLCCLRLTATHMPADDPREQANLTLKDKMQASNRTRPNPEQILHAFSMPVELAKAAGTRKSTKMLLQEALNQFNSAEALSKRRLSAEEQGATVFLHGRSKEFRRLMKMVWGQERPEHTAVPVNLLNSKFLLEESPLPVNKKDNPWWHATLEVTEPKLQLWLERQWGRWCAQLEIVEMKGRKASLRNDAALYRDSEPELVWRMVCVTEVLLHDKKDQPEHCGKIKKAFLRGVLDAAMLAEVTAMRKEFRPDSLMLTDEYHSVGPGDQEARVESAQELQRSAEFRLVSELLAAEQMKWRRYLTLLSSWESQNAADIISHKERLHDAWQNSALLLRAEQYCVSSVPDFQAAGVFSASFARTVSELYPPVDTASLLLVDWWNLPMLGPDCAKHVAEMARRLQMAAAQNPTTWAAIVMLPNQAGGETAPGMSHHRIEQEVAKFQRKVVAEIQKDHDDLRVIPCSAHYEEDSFYAEVGNAERSVQVIKVSFVVVAVGAATTIAGRVSAGDEQHGGSARQAGQSVREFHAGQTQNCSRAPDCHASL